ncbi:hypothetical protein DGG96_15480 [Legionella qingyii]|uniref:Toll/interleukin-1 receptor domain-containing protein n=1 Tax=Legionella qingyii TaxID=2184757 RepID=A0A317U098_9GAMM|nr:toll/interleukin-1 receptor domain-containing protein [Legionella qingyii]PWY54779.1 hypothetical protein DGG96_15480 [Legionella qingyii]RUR20853.1 toll/interleukin-1 receptor domain-containing protein [Legionella qingyii]
MINVRNGSLVRAPMALYLSQYLREQTRLISLEIDTATEQQMSNEHAYINACIEKNTIKLLTPEWDRHSITHAQKEISPHELDPISAMRFGMSPFQNKSHQQEILIYKVPCTGDLTLLNMAPNTNMLASLPQIQISNETLSFEVVIDTFNPDQTKQTLENYINWIKQHINYLNHDLNEYNVSLKEIVLRLCNKRKLHIDSISSMIKNIGIPMNRSTDELQPPTPMLPAQNDKVNYHSVAISYGGLDEDIADKLNDFLIQNGVKTWFYPEHSLPGEKLHRMMSNMINEADRVILLCSKSSLHRNGVLNELERILEREAREGASAILIPIALDKYVFEEWTPEKKDLADQIRTRNIISLNNIWDSKQMQRLLLALTK